jgi:hypothetical protein
MESKPSDLKIAFAELCGHLIQIEGRIKQLELTSYAIRQALIDGDRQFEIRYQKHLQDPAALLLTDGAFQRISALQKIIQSLQK